MCGTNTFVTIPPHIEKMNSLYSVWIIKVFMGAKPHNGSLLYETAL